jgi:hypothetical protein
LSSSSLISRSAEFLEAEVDGELVALHVDKGTCYGFNGSATRIWNLLAEPRSLDQLCDALMDEFDVDHETCRNEVKPVLRELAADGLVTIEGELG